MAFFNVVIHILLQREVSAAVDAVAATYRENTPVNERTTSGVWTAMTNASKLKVKQFRSKAFDKYLAVASPTNEDAFFDEVFPLLQM